MKALVERVGVFTTPALAAVILIGACYVFFSEPAAVSIAQAPPTYERTKEGSLIRFELVSHWGAEGQVQRAKVPGGWLVTINGAAGPPFGLTFVPDPKHRWDTDASEYQVQAAEDEKARRVKHSEIFDSKPPSDFSR